MQVNIRFSKETELKKVTLSHGARVSIHNTVAVFFKMKTK